MPDGSHLRAAVMVALSLALSACPAPGPAGPAPFRPRIDTLALRIHTKYLAGDQLEGRGTGTRGAAQAAAYLESQCEALDLEPLGPRYLLDVPLDEVRVRSGVLAVSARGDTTRLAPSADYLVVGGGRGALTAFSGRPVYLGTDEQLRAPDASLPSLAGTVAVTGGVVRVDVARRIAQSGALALLQLTGDSEDYALYRAGRGPALTLFRDSTVESSFHPPLPSFVLAPDAVNPVAAAVRAGGTVRARQELVARPIHAWNVACVLPGTGGAAADTLIALTAHYDHLGISLPDSNGDSIYNGFSDNAAGVAMVLAAAQAIRASPRGALRHGVALLFFTGEERGLLGSDYFVAHPPVPLARFRAVVNLDAGAPPARPWNWRVAGGEGTPLGGLAVDVAAARGWAATVSPPTPNSDYFPFSRRGVPAVFLIPGAGPYEGLTADSSNALRHRWDRYHQAGDEYHDDFPFAGLRRYAEYALALVEAIDGGGAPPARLRR